MKTKKVYSASVTPLTEEGRIDVTSLGRLIGFGIERGIDGFFLLGTTGEWFTLSASMKRELVGAAVDAASGRAEILVGINGSGLAAIRENRAELSRFAASAYVVQYPSGHAAPLDAVDFMHGIADEADKPVYLYYLPQITGVSLSKEQFEAILAHPNIAGVKNSSDSLRTRRELLGLRSRLDFQLLEGQEWVVDESLALGCDGALVGLASLDAKMLRELADAVDRGDLDAARATQQTLLTLFDGIYGSDLSTVWSGQKYALHLLGILDSWKTLVPSNAGLTGEQKARIEECVQQFRSRLV